MSLIHYVKPFLDLGICKEYSMARKTTGNVSSTRGKKANASVAPVELEKMADSIAEIPEVSNDVVKDVRSAKSSNPVPINQRSINQHSINQNSSGQIPSSQSSAKQSSISPELEEEIRHRAYELYLERTAKGDEASGDPHQDWLTAEREILSRNGSRGLKLA
jgi:hypothetical protein